MPYEPGKPFRAKFDQTCVTCGGDIAPGQLISTTPSRRGYHFPNCNPELQAAANTSLNAASGVIELPSEPKQALAWSDLQTACFEAAVDSNSGNLILEAVAGSGKTTVLVEIAKRLLRAFPRSTITYVAFNADIVKESKPKFPWNVEVATFHSVWFRSLQRHLNVRLEPDRDKVRKILRDRGLRGDIRPQDQDEYGSGALKLVAAAKGAGIGVPGCREDTPENWLALVDRFDVEFDGMDTSIGIELARRLLAWNNADLTSIDFDDMLYLSALLGVQCTQSDFVEIDESQDFNEIQRVLVHRMLKPGGKLIAVGDRNQSIYGFRGADYDSMDRIKNEFNCRELPLDISYRCPQLVVEEAQAVVSHIQASPSAPMGVVEHHPSWRMAEFLPTDVVLCRCMAPLVGLAYKALSQRVPCRVLGRDIGSGLVSLIKKLNAQDIETLESRLDAYVVTERLRLIARMKEDKAQALEDKAESIRTAISNLTGERTIEHLIDEIESLFSDKPAGVLTLSTVHRAKGKEWQRVFLLDRRMMPLSYAKTTDQRQQESNIIYVALTRAKSELHYINSDSIQ